MPKKSVKNTNSSKSATPRIRKKFIIWLFIILFPILLFTIYFKWLDYLSSRNEEHLQNIASTIEVPKDWKYLSEEVGGNLSCLDTCQYYTITYEASLNLGEAEAKLKTVLNSVDIDLNKIEGGCTEGDNFNKSMCSFYGRSEQYKVSGVIIFEQPLSSNKLNLSISKTKGITN